MMVSTRGRYALRVIIDLAEQDKDGYTAMKEVAARQDISLKYLERILPCLVAAEMIEGVHGKGGGYRLKRSPDQITVGEILRLTEGDIVPANCQCGGSEPCTRTADCRTKPMWIELSDIINNYLNSVTIADLMR